MLFKRKEKSIFYDLLHWRDFRLKIFIEGTIIGLIAGLLIVWFRYLIDESGKVLVFVNDQIKVYGVPAIIVWFLILILIGIFLSLIIKKEPMAKGSGIPEVEGVLAGQLKMNWARVIIGKFVGGVIGIGAGLSLGREGPSIQLGAAVGQGFSRILGRLRVEEKYLITSGASAGLAAAFNAPLAGVIFALEELHKNFSPAVLMSAMAASLTADFVTQQAFGSQTVFSFHTLSVFPLHYYFYLIGLGIISGVFGAFFNKSLLKTLKLYDNFKLPRIFAPGLPLVIAGILGFVLPEVLGGGNMLIESMAHGNFTIKMLIVLVIVKFLFTMVSYGSGVPGGIFLPLLVIGALTGNIYGNIIANFLHIEPQYITNFVVLGMAAYFTAIVKAPITGSILITEMTGSFQHLLALITVSMTAYVVSDIMKSKPIYDTLLERALEKHGKTSMVTEKGKTILEVAVCVGSQLDGKRIKDIPIPPYCLLVSIKRGEKEIIPNGNTKISSGDYLYVLVNADQAAQIKEKIMVMAGELCNV